MDSWLLCHEFMLFVKERSGLDDFCENQRPMVRGGMKASKLNRNRILARGIKQSTGEEGAQVEGGALLEIGPLAA